MGKSYEDSFDDCCSCSTMNMPPCSFCTDPRNTDPEELLEQIGILEKENAELRARLSGETRAGKPQTGLVNVPEGREPVRHDGVVCVQTEEDGDVSDKSTEDILRAELADAHAEAVRIKRDATMTALNNCAIDHRMQQKIGACREELIAATGRINSLRDLLIRTIKAATLPEDSELKKQEIRHAVTAVENSYSRRSQCAAQPVSSDSEQLVAIHGALSRIENVITDLAKPPDRDEAMKRLRMRIVQVTHESEEEILSLSRTINALTDERSSTLEAFDELKHAAGKLVNTTPDETTADPFIVKTDGELFNKLDAVLRRVAT